MQKNYYIFTSLVRLLYHFVSFILVLIISGVWLGLNIVTRFRIMLFTASVLWIYRSKIWDKKWQWIPNFSKILSLKKKSKDIDFRPIWAAVCLPLVFILPISIFSLLFIYVIFWQLVLNRFYDAPLLFRLVLLLFASSIFIAIFNPLTVAFAIVGLIAYKPAFWVASVLLICEMLFLYFCSNYRKLIPAKAIYLFTAPIIITGIFLFTLFYLNLFPFGCNKINSKWFSDTFLPLQNTIYSMKILGDKLYLVDCYKKSIIELNSSLTGKTKSFKFSRWIMDISFIPKNKRFLVTAIERFNPKDHFSVYSVKLTPKFQHKLIEACPAPFFITQDKDSGKIFILCIRWIAVLDSVKLKLMQKKWLKDTAIYDYAIDEKRKRIVLISPNRNDGVFSLSNLKMIKKLYGYFDVGITYDSKNDKYYISKAIPPSIKVIDGKNFKFIKTIKSPIYRKIFFHPETGWLIGGGFTSPHLDIINPKNGKFIARLPVGPNVRSIISGKEKNHIYVASNCGIYDIDLTKIKKNNY